MIGLCKKLSIIHNIITCDPEPQTKLGTGSFGQFVLMNWFSSLNVIMQWGHVYAIILVKVQIATGGGTEALNDSFVTGSNTPVFWLISSRSDYQTLQSDLRNWFNYFTKMN